MTIASHHALRITRTLALVGALSGLALSGCAASVMPNDGSMQDQMSPPDGQTLTCVCCPSGDLSGRCPDLSQGSGDRAPIADAGTGFIPADSSGSRRRRRKTRAAVRRPRTEAPRRRRKTRACRWTRGFATSTRPRDSAGARWTICFLRDPTDRSARSRARWRRPKSIFDGETSGEISGARLAMTTHSVAEQREP